MPSLQDKIEALTNDELKKKAEKLEEEAKSLESLEKKGRKKASKKKK